MSIVEGRVYAGQTPAQRDAQRRAQFLDAGLDVFATSGWVHATVLEICRSARLSQRYFYELFASREALFLAVVQAIADDVEALVRAAASEPDQSPIERADSVLRALATYFSDDPRTVRVTLIEMLATPQFRARRSELLARFSTLAAQLMRALHPDPTRADGARLELSARILSGGVAEAFMAAADQAPMAKPEQLIEHLRRMYATAARDAL